MADKPAPDFSVKPTLVGQKAVLRPFIPAADLAALREMLQDPEAMMLTGSIHGPGETLDWDVSAEAAFRNWYGTRNQQPDRLDLAVTDKATGQCVGEVVLNDWNAGNHSCSFRTCLGPSGRDRGLGSEAMRMIVGYGFDQLGLHRIELQVYAFNPRAQHVYEKAGFVAEGVLRDALRWDGGWIDATIMAVLASEWNRHEH